MIHNPLVHQGANITLRGISLAAKLVLTLYMGRYLGLADLGVYGIVFAAVMIFCVVLGGRLDYVVAREIIEASPVETFRKIRDQLVFCVLNCGLFTVLALLALELGLSTPLIVGSVLVIASLESIDNMILVNFISLGKPLLSTFLFFLRAGLWSLLVVALGVFFPATRHVEVVLAAWALGSLSCFVVAMWCWRHAPWRAVMSLPVDWRWMKTAVRQCFPIWLGTIGGAGAIYIDRFVVSHHLTIHDVGVITFYGSFATALLALQQSGFFAFSYPRMVRYHRRNDTSNFWRETVKTAWQSCLFVAVASIAIGWGVPLLADHFHKPELAEQAPTLWLMLAAVWIRGNADTFHYILYARDQDWAVWMAGVLFLVPAAIGNLVFVPMAGLIGVGYSGILASIFLFLWRGYFVWRPEKNIFEKVIAGESNNPEMAEFRDR